MWAIISYSPETGMGDLDAPLGWTLVAGQGYDLQWLVGSYSRDSIARFNVEQIAKDIAAKFKPHIPGGTIAVMPG